MEKAIGIHIVPDSFMMKGQTWYLTYYSKAEQ